MKNIIFLCGISLIAMAVSDTRLNQNESGIKNYLSSNEERNSFISFIEQKSDLIFSKAPPALDQIKLV